MRVMSELLNEIRAKQEDLLEDLEQIKDKADAEMLPALEEIRQKQKQILETIEEIQDEIHLS